MHLRSRFQISAVLVAASVGVAQAQVSLLTRESTIVYNYLYGWSTDLHQANEAFHDYALESSDSMTHGHSGTTSGTFASFWWDAGATGSFTHQFAIGGPLSNMTSITASASSAVTNYALGDGLAESDSQNPGNLINFEFSVTGNTEYSLSATYGGVNGYNPTLLRLQKWDGFAWQMIATNMFDGPNGTISSSGNLTSGLHRMWSSVDIASYFINEGASNGEYNYTLTFGQPVPEPATIAVLGVGAWCLRRRLKHTK